MYKVVIIDDEALVRIGLKSMINWHEQDCEIIGEAANGQAGYDLVANLNPHIVITDIKMPLMDGLKMIEKLKEINNKSRFIILSGYDEFDLVRKAMKYGVEDYLIKLELEPQLLLDILSKLKEKIVIDFKKQDEKYRTEKYLMENRLAMREEFFKRVIGKITKDEKEIQEELDYLKISLNKDSIICAAILVSNAGKFDNFEKADINLLEFSILNVVDEIVSDFFLGYSFRWKINEYDVIFSIEDESEEKNINDKIRTMSDRIITMLKQYFNIDATVGISNINKGLDSISNAHIESRKALQQSFYKGREKILFFSDIDSNENIKKETNQHEIDNLLKYIELNDQEAIGIVFQEIINYLNDKAISKDLAYDLCAKITYLISIAVRNDEKSLEIIFGDNKSIFEKISKLESIQDIEDWLRKIEKGIYSYLLSQSKEQNNKLISMAKKIIKDNIGKVISLQDVAFKLNISSGYLSTMFKQSTGVSFIDYVTEVKIGEAKRLLRGSNYKIYEIAQMTGYENAYYFSKVFKKVTGMTPKEFEMKTY